jgi:glutamate racemase
MAKAEAERLADRKVLIIGTAFTACQSVYPEIVRTAAPGAHVDSIAATELERAIARFESWESSGNAVLTGGLRRAVADTEVAVLACTCFALIRRELEALFPEVVFLDPGAYSAGLLNGNAANRVMDLQIAVTGDVVEPARVKAFAESYFGNACSVS